MASRRSKRVPLREDGDEGEKAFLFTTRPDPPKVKVWKGRWATISPDASPVLNRFESTLSLNILIPSITPIRVLQKEEVSEEEEY